MATTRTIRSGSLIIYPWPRTIMPIILVLFLPYMIASMSFMPQSEEVSLTIRVIAPPSTSDEGRLVVVGGDSIWGGWNPASGIPLSRESDSVWSITRGVPKGYALEFKITRGSWDTEALYEPGRRPPNSSVLVEEDTIVTLRPLGWADGILLHTPEGPSNDIVGTVRYHRGMKGARLRYPRDIVVWLPGSYLQDPEKRYPVLYMQDGQNIVDPRTSSFGYDWRIDEVADSLTHAQAMEEIIVVGIYNSPDRSAEYSNTETGRNYADFVIETLKPFIDSTYRTKPGPHHTAVMGSSSGGLISFLFAWWHPDIFWGAACLSANFSIDAGDILQEVRDYEGPPKNIHVYLDMGSKGVDRRLRAGCEAMFSLLKDKGYENDRDVVYYYDDGANHNEQAWAARVWRPLTFLFGTSSSR
jgi:predicted alpha/beta superfamily hydrolase